MYQEWKKLEIKKKCSREISREEMECEISSKWDNIKIYIT
jgi:hypothetical protein